jgi:hypothetical protein
MILCILQDNNSITNNNIILVLLVFSYFNSLFQKMLIHKCLNIKICQFNINNIIA